MAELATHIIEDREEESGPASRANTGVDSDTNSPQKKKTAGLVSLLLLSCANQAAAGGAGDGDAAAVTEPTLGEKLSRELEFYIRLTAHPSDDVFQWWRSHTQELSNLSKIARYILNACATSVPSEHLFSLSGNIVTKKRNALKPHLVDKLVFLSFNKDLM